MRGLTRLNANWMWTAAVSCCAGCGATQNIAGSANEIRMEARMLLLHGKETGDDVVVQAAERIDLLAAQIHGYLPGTQNMTPWWGQAIAWVAGAALVIAIVVFLWFSGIGQFIRVAVGWLPRRKVAQAELAVDMLDPDRPEGDREMVAALRSDPEFDAAYRKAQQRKKNAPR